jgi:hypothetical protein
MRFPKRAPRQVYRVFEEDEFLGDSAATPREVLAAEDDRPRGGPEMDLSRAERRRSRPLAAALLVAAAVSAGEIAVDGLSTLRRGRSRNATSSRPPTASSRAGKRPGRSYSARYHRRRPRSRVGAIRPARRTPAGRSVHDAGGGPIGLPVPPPPAEPSLAPNPGEFSFEREIAR